jgi:sugar/nucleoside kinase (ribokinase family)
MNVLVAGNSVLDLHATVPDEETSFGTGWVENNVQFLSDAPHVVLGGNGAATSYTLGMLGVPVFLNTAIGCDPFGGLIEGWLSAAGVKLVGQKVDSTPVNIVRNRSTDGARLSSYFAGEKVDWRIGLEGEATDWFFASGYGLVSAADFDSLTEAFHRSKSNGSRVGFDPGPWFERKVSREPFRSAMSVVDCLIGTEDELQTWSDASSVDAMIEDYLGMGIERVVVKQGAEGASFGDVDGNRGHVSGHPIQEAHAVGAGDTFNGALLAGFCEERSLDECVKIAVQRAERAVRSGRGALGAFD